MANSCTARAPPDPSPPCCRGTSCATATPRRSTHRATPTRLPSTTPRSCRATSNATTRPVGARERETATTKRDAPAEPVVVDTVCIPDHSRRKRTPHHDRGPEAQHLKTWVQDDADRGEQFVVRIAGHCGGASIARTGRGSAHNQLHLLVARSVNITD